MKKHIPNLFTCLNLFCGVWALTFVGTGRIIPAIILIGVALVADFLDGFLARILGVASPMGKELDSIADMVTFGAVPGFIMASLIQQSQGLVFLPDYSLLTPDSSPLTPQLYILGFFVSVFSGLRLAKFNIDERQSDSFYGVPTPAMTILILSFWMIVEFSPDSLLAGWLQNLWVLLGLTAVCSYLLVADVRLLALKFKNFTLKDNLFRYILVISAIVLVAIFRHMAIPFVILLYIGLSLVKNLLDKQK